MVGASSSLTNVLLIVQLRRSNVKEYTPASVTFHLLSGSPACIANVAFVIGSREISVPLISGRMNPASQLPGTRHSFISPAYRGPSHTNTRGSSSVAVRGVGASMLHPLGVASPTIYRVDVLMGKFPSIIMRSFSSSHDVSANPIRAAKTINIFLNFIVLLI